MRLAVALFAMAVVAQWLVPLLGVWQHERVIRHGTVVRVRCTAPDPYDPLRGRHLTVRPETTTLPKPDDLPANRPVPAWATLVADADGLSRIASVALMPVAGPTVVQLTATERGWNRDQRMMAVHWPTQRFYLNERLAPAADAILAARWRSDARPVAEFHILDGRAVLTDVLLDGIPIRELMNRPQR